MGALHREQRRFPAAERIGHRRLHLMHDRPVAGDRGVDFRAGGPDLVEPVGDLVVLVGHRAHHLGADVDPVVHRVGSFVRFRQLSSTQLVGTAATGGAGDAAGSIQPRKSGPEATEDSGTTCPSCSALTELSATT